MCMRSMQRVTTLASTLATKHVATEGWNDERFAVRNPVLNPYMGVDNLVRSILYTFSTCRANGRTRPQSRLSVGKLFVV